LQFSFDFDDLGFSVFVFDCFLVLLCVVVRILGLGFAEGRSAFDSVFVEINSGLVTILLAISV
jgi:hypothetical protein